jgi:REP element-mobilizing transposase RayT
MPRKLRVEYPGAIYHVMSRGDQREDIFLNDVDRHDFLKSLAEACQKADWQVHAFCLMRNHYHLVVETPNGNLVSGMAWLQSTYTIRLNHRHHLTGHVLSGRYKAQLVDGRATGYLKTACDYVHLNPVRAPCLAPEDRLLAYPWSSFPWYLAAREHRPRWLRVDRLLGEHGIERDTPAGRQEFERHLERRRLEELNEVALAEFRQAWSIGSEAFRQECLQRMEGKVGENHPGQTRQETAEAKAERIVAEELARLRWTPHDLATQQKSHPLKLALAARLRRETTLSVKQIAQRLHLGKPKGARSNLHKFMNNPRSNRAQIRSGDPIKRETKEKIYRLTRAPQ